MAKVGPFTSRTSIALHPSGEDDVLCVGLQSPTHARFEEATTALRAAGVSVTQGTAAEIAHRRTVDFVKFERGDLPFELSIGPCRLCETD